MAQQKTVDIELGGKVRTMRLDLNALCGLAKEGEDIESLKLLLGAGKTTLLTVRLMLWAFLITDTARALETGQPNPNHVPNFEKEVVGGWIDASNMATCGLKLGEFINSQPTTENPTQAGETGPTPVQ